MLLKNAQILNDQFEWMRGDIRITDGRISEIGLSLADEPYTVDCTGLLAVPGRIIRPPTWTPWARPCSLKPNAV